MRVLGIETSCDETAAAVVEDGRRVISNIVASQVRVHKTYRGVVPEIASRCHVEHLLPVVAEALKQAGSNERGEGIDAIAVTRGPGLVGALLVGVETAKALALAWDRPLIAVHHTLGHLHSVFCDLPEGRSRVIEILPDDGAVPALTKWPSSPSNDGMGDAIDRQEHGSGQTGAAFDYPFLGLVVSGGHSSLVRVDGPGRVCLLGNTLDDAPGEAYDKVARSLGLDYPGGPEVDRRAAQGDAGAFNLPRPVLHSHGYDFSFSGLKTAVVQEIGRFGGVEKLRADEEALCGLCASFQAAVIDVLLTKTRRALKKQRLKRLAVVGGVACNQGLRTEAVSRFKDAHLAIQSPILCTDNAAMIAAAGAHLEPLEKEEALRLDARAGWALAPAAERRGGWTRSTR